MNAYRPCPVCLKKEFELLHTITYPAGENRILPVEYQIVCCSQCGMVFDTFEADETVFDNYYSKENKYAIDNTAGSGGYSVNEKKRFQRIVNFLKSQRIDKNADIMDIGSGKDLAEYGNVPYHLIDVAEPGEPYDLFAYLNAAQTAVRDIAARGHLPILCGGSKNDLPQQGPEIVKSTQVEP